MTLRILAVLAEAVTAKACLEGALAAAMVQPDAQIEALHVKVDPDKLVGAPEEIAIQHLRERYEGTAADRALEVRAVFDSWLSHQAPADIRRIRWREEVGAETEKVLQEADGADLLVLAHPHDLDAHDAMHAILSNAARPLLIPPDWSSPKNKGPWGHIVIAWKPTPQAQKAVLGAGAWLRAASKVTVLTIEENKSADSVAQISLMLHELGVAAEFLAAVPEGDPADQILKVAHDLAADALVMGAYRHSEFIEWALGGTTRHVLAKADIPLFLAH